MPNQQISKCQALPATDNPPKGLEDESTLYTLGEEFLAAARALRDTPVTSTGYRSVLYYLLGHAAELFLKAYLYAHNVPIKALVKIRHDLEALLDHAHTHGLPNHVPMVAVRSLSPLYNAKRLEYRDQSTKRYPSLEDLFSEVEQLSVLAFPHHLFQPGALPK